MYPPVLVVDDDVLVTALKLYRAHHHVVRTSSLSLLASATIAIGTPRRRGTTAPHRARQTTRPRMSVDDTSGGEYYRVTGARPSAWLASNERFTRRHVATQWRIDRCVGGGGDDGGGGGGGGGDGGGGGGGGAGGGDSGARTERS